MSTTTKEVICLSSEDDDESHQSKINGHSAKKLKPNESTGKSSSEIIADKHGKRKLTISDDKPVTKKIILSRPEKKMERKSSDDHIEIIEVVLHTEEQPSTSACELSNGNKNEDKPLLIVREKHPVDATNGGQTLFSMFLSQCLQRERSKDMEKIVEKLKRHYEQLDPTYARSEEFAELLSEKRNCLMKEDGLLFTHITDVRDEMKLRKRGKDIVSANVSCSPSKEDAEDDEEEADEDPEIARRRKQKIKLLEKTMANCEKQIKKLEESEVDFDDEDDSAYMKVEKYKNRIVELHAKWCELTGNHKDAGRSYLRPKHYKLTGIVTVDQAINSFVNAKLPTLKKHKKTTSSTVNTISFPDYVDILKLIHVHNTNQKLGMDTRAEKAAAKSAFTKLGGYLKSERQKDFFDTFSLMHENGEDPAKKNHDLLQKLQENRELGEAKLNKIFEEYCKKQEDAKASNANLSTDTEKDDEDEIDEENVSDTSIVHSDESSNEISEKTDKENSKITENCKISLTKEDTEVQEATVQIVDDAKDLSEVEKPPKIITNPSDNQELENKKDKVSIDEVSEKEVEVNSAAREMPLLKLRSFAKPSEFWKNFQEPEEANSDTIVMDDSVTNEKTIQIIDLEDSEEQKNSTEVARHTSPNKSRINSSAGPSNSAPTIAANKHLFLKKIVAIPATKIQGALSNAVQSSLRVDHPTNPVPGGVIVRHPPPPTRRYVPLSSVEIRIGQNRRPVAHIIGQRTTTTLVQDPKERGVKPAQTIRVASTSSAAHSILRTAPTLMPRNIQSILSAMRKPTPKVTLKEGLKLINPLAKRPNNDAQQIVVGEKKDLSPKSTTVNIVAQQPKTHFVFKENEPGI